MAVRETTTLVSAAASTTPSDTETSLRALWSYALPVLPATLLIVLSLVRFYKGYAGSDLAILDQSIWLISEGRPAFSTILQESFLQDHFSPAVYLFAPLYRLLATPAWLLVAQGLAVLGSIWLIVARLRQSIGDLRAGLVGAALMVSPPVALALLYEVHLIVLGIPFALAAIWSIDDNKLGKATILGLIAATFRIELGICVLMACLVIPRLDRRRLSPILTLTCYALVAIFIQGGAGQRTLWEAHYGHLGASPLDIALHPWSLLSFLGSAAVIYKLTIWSITNGFIAWRNARLLIPLTAVALPVLLSDWAVTDKLFSHYHAAPVLLMSVAWIPLLIRRPARAKVIVAANVALSLLIGPLNPSFVLGSVKGSVERSGELQCLVSTIPSGAVVSAEDRPMTLLAHRSNLYFWPYPFRPGPADYQETTRHPDATLAAAVDYVVVERATLDREAVPPGFGPDVTGEDYVVLRRVGAPKARDVTECS